MSRVKATSKFLHPDKHSGTRAYHEPKRKFVPSRLVSERRCGLCGAWYKGDFVEHLAHCKGGKR